MNPEPVDIIGTLALLTGRPPGYVAARLALESTYTEETA